MRAIAGGAGVPVPTVASTFGTKARAPGGDRCAWAVERYELWFAESIVRLLVGAVTPILTKAVVPSRPKPPARPGNRSMR